MSEVRLRVAQGSATQLLHEEEIAIINRVVDIFLEKINSDAVAGIFGMYAQRKGAEAESCAVSVLRQGAGEATDVVLQDSIELVTQWPENMVLACQPDPLRFGELPSGVYRGDRSAAVIVINTSLGRFIATLRIGGLEQDFGAMKVLAAGLAKGLLMLRPNDAVLKNSLGELLGMADARGADLVDAVADMFETRAAEITVWRLRCNERPPEMFFI